MTYCHDKIGSAVDNHHRNAVLGGVEGASE